MENQTDKRAAGILCHISSLNGKYGIGSLGKEAYNFVDFLERAHAKYWQILPLAQTGFGDSPYQSVCAGSGNPYFIDLEILRDKGLLTDDELLKAEVEGEKVDYAQLYIDRYKLLRTAFSRFDIESPDFVAFIESGKFEDYALFMSLKTKYSCTFDNFPEEYKCKRQPALGEFRASVYSTEYCFWLFLQYEFLNQWSALKSYANQKGIKIIGDIPLYVAYDSADVWGRPDIFQLDEELKPTRVAGVPPDYFSKTGQLWGNPLYNWNTLKAQGYEWWVERIKNARELYDVIRIDHFRGLDRYYSIPVEAETSEIGEWCEGPKTELFNAIKSRLGEVEIIAEDLGVLDDGVINLREDTGYPGMKILMFAFDGEGDNDYLPERIEENSVTYTGTHDNDTTLGFLDKMTEEEFSAFKTRLRASMKKLGLNLPFTTRSQTAYALAVTALATKSTLAVIPIQDLLLLNTYARMNTPSTRSDNWQFRLKETPGRYFAAIMRKAVKFFNR